MSRVKIFGPAIGVIMAFALVLSGPAHAEKRFTTHNGSGDIQWSTQIAHRNATISVSGPSGFYLRKSSRSLNGLRLSRLPKDGQYHYEIVLTPLIERVRPEDDAKTIRKSQDTGNVHSGSFRVVNGAIADPRIPEAR